MDMAESYTCRLDWGRRGARRAAEKGDVLVIVDVLSFSSLVATALHYGLYIYPCAESEDTAEKARIIGGEPTVHRAEVPGKGRFSLSPLTYIGKKAGTKVAVSSPNGATCSRYADRAPAVFAGCLLNYRAVAEIVTKLVNESTGSVTVIACGEREKQPNEDGPIRWAVEDYLGAGAIISELSLEKSPDALVCEAAYMETQDMIGHIIRNCPSGKELHEMGFDRDIDHSIQLNIYDNVPVMRNGFFTDYKQLNGL
jgi:2-phosphosulfolactate phosphatase